MSTAQFLRSDRLERRVQNGAALLDQVRPGWAREIALDRLAMETCDRCLLGQLWGEYRAGFRSLLESLPASQLFSSADHGFTLYGFEQEDVMEKVMARFAALTAAWRAAIRERTGGGPP